MLSEGEKLRRMREAELKRRDKERIRELREELRAVRRKRPERMAVIRELCRQGRAVVRARARELRAQTLQRLRQELELLRLSQKNQCSSSRLSERVAIRREIEKKRGELLDARRSFRHHYGRKRSRATRVERAEESQHEVIANLPPELVPVFKRVSSHIKGGPRRTRTEAFLEWVEENPDEAHGIVYEQVDRDVERMIREHQELERKARRRA